MEPGRLPARMPNTVVTRPRPDSPDCEDAITIDLSIEASAALAPPPRTPASTDLPEALRGMYYTG